MTDTSKPLMKYKKGDTIIFKEDKKPFKVRCADGRFIICTRMFNRRNDSDLIWAEVQMGGFMTFSSGYEFVKDTPIYSIIDLKENIRGTENLVFCMGFHSDADCKRALKRLSSGETEISHRNRIELNIINHDI